MAIVSLNDPEDVMRDVISKNKIIKCDLGALNAKGKEQIKFFLNEVLKDLGIEDYLDDIFLSVMELSFNAVKANYAYIVVLDRVKKILSHKFEQIDLDSIWKSKYMMTMYKNFINQPITLDKVKDIIRGEAEVFKIKALAEKENRELSEDEKKKIKSNLGMMNRSIQEKVKATLSISKAPSRVIIDVINDAPITNENLKRVELKRKKFREYYEQDRIGEFYMENLDESQSAGFGAAMIDSRLLAWDLDPIQHFKVLSLNKKTCASLTIVF